MIVSVCLLNNDHPVHVISKEPGDLACKEERIDNLSSIQFESDLLILLDYSVENFSEP